MKTGQKVYVIRHESVVEGKVVAASSEWVILTIGKSEHAEPLATTYESEVLALRALTTQLRSKKPDTIVIQRPCPIVPTWPQPVTPIKPRIEPWRPIFQHVPKLT